MPIGGWTGFYLGGNVGGRWTDGSATTSPVFSPTGYFATTSPPAIAQVGQQRLNDAGVTGGLTLGYNWQVNNFVAGFEGDLNYFGLDRKVTGSGIYPCCAPTGFTVTTSATIDWLLTLRGRAGWLASPNLLLYVTGGAAIAEIKRVDFRFTDTFATAAENQLFRDDARVRWTVGGGGEYQVGYGWSVKAEYLFVGLGTVRGTSTNLTAFVPPIAFPTNTFTHSIDLNTHIGRFGINYRFASQ